MGDGKDHIFTTNLCHVVTCTRSISPSIWRTFVELDCYNIGPLASFQCATKLNSIQPVHLSLGLSEFPSRLINTLFNVFQELVLTFNLLVNLFAHPPLCLQ